MMDAPSSTWFTLAPHWRWWIVLYFFFGGLAGGCYFLAVLIDLFGRPADRPLARLGYYIAFPLVVLCGLLLIVDLNQPLRFWHMLIQRNTFAPMFKLWSPMSTGSWALLIFGAFSFGGFLTALADDDRLASPRLRALQPRLRPLRALTPPSLPGRFFAVLGGIFGFFIAGYTGVLLAVTNRPIWSDTQLLGLLFIVSAASTSAALMILLAHRRGWTMPAVAALHRMDVWMIVLELVVLAAVIVSLGPVLAAWLNAWGALLVVGVVIVGLLVPLAMSWRPRALRPSSVTTASILVLIGGFLLRVVVVLSSESV
jgi:formate-dependent nitrite reductase membrane component NrfD